jgi:2-methylisocitrate lyase-like PEP mutase family enzyme
LVAKGLERCKADDDAGADDLFAQAMKLTGK